MDATQVVSYCRRNKLSNTLHGSYMSSVELGQSSPPFTPSPPHPHPLTTHFTAAPAPNLSKLTRYEPQNYSWWRIRHEH